jgi:hypothetical protein
VINYEEPAYSVVRLAAGEGKGMPVLLLHITDDDVQQARDQVRAGNLGSLPVRRVVVSFLWSLDVDPAGQAWTGGEYVELLEMLGMPVFEWSPLDDAELTRLLAKEASSHG